MHTLDCKPAYDQKNNTKFEKDAVSEHYEDHQTQCGEQAESESPTAEHRLITCQGNTDRRVAHLITPTRYPASDASGQRDLSTCHVNLYRNMGQ